MMFWIGRVVLILCLGLAMDLSNSALAKTKSETKKSAKPKKKVVKKKTSKLSGKEMSFAFANVKLKLKITKSATAAPGAEFKDVIKRDDHSAILHFATPQLREEPIHKVPVLLLTQFEGEETLRSDIRDLGYAYETKTEDAGVPRQLPLPRGYLFFWTTPSMGSANYYYLQHPREKNIAIRIGPIGSAVDKDYTIDWAGARWPK